jgi:hypothetical protein
MTPLACSDFLRRRAVVLSAALAVLLGVCALAVLAGDADPATAARAKMLGKTKKTPGPSCPGKRGAACEAVGSVSGFQTKAGGTTNPFKVPRDGRLVAWSVDISRPKPAEQRFFGKLYRGESFGTDPSARVSVLGPKGKKKYKLKRHTPAVDLSEYLGQKPIFTLGNPLSIKKGDVLALTLPTWLSDFAVELRASKNKWRASRSGNACDIGTDTSNQRKNLRKSKPQEQVGSTRPYACVYRGARLLYWGFMTGA